MPVAESGPKYPIPWIATYFITALVLIVGSFVAVWYVNQPASKFDYNDPDMAFLERIVLSPAPEEGNFTKLNGGDWTTLCLVGWQGDLKKALNAAGIKAEPARALSKVYEAVSADVEMSEFVLVYVDGSDSAKAVLHPHGFAFARTGAAVCTTSRKPLLDLPAER
jgi:hypothetical protein